MLKDRSVNNNTENMEKEIVVYQVEEQTIRSSVLMSNVNINKFWLMGKAEIAYFVSLVTKVKLYIYSIQTKTLLNVITFKRQTKDRQAPPINQNQQQKQNKYHVFQSINCICVIWPKQNSISTIRLYRLDTQFYRQSTKIYEKDVEICIEKIQFMQHSSTIYWTNINKQIICQVTLLKVQQRNVIQNYYQFDLNSCLDVGRKRALTINSVEQVNQNQLYIHLSPTLFKQFNYAQFLVFANKTTHQPKFLSQRYQENSRSYMMMRHCSHLSFVMNMVLNSAYEDESELIYLDKLTGRVVSRWTLDQSRYIVNNFSSSRDRLSLILTDNKSEHTNYNVLTKFSSRQLIVKHFFKPKLQYLHWLLLQNQDFDDDLLQEAIQLLQADPQNQSVTDNKYTNQ